MIKATVYNIEGQAVDEIDLDESIFGVSENEALVHHCCCALGGRPIVALSGLPC